MDIDQLISAGGIVDCTPVEKEVTWDGNTFTVKVKTIGYGDFDRVVNHSADDVNSNAALIAQSIILGDNGVLTYEQAYQLKPSLAAEFVRVIMEVNRPKS